MKQAFVNGEPISREAVQFELDRLVKFYVTHGMGKETIQKNLEKLAEKAQEQAVGAKLLLDRAAQLDLPVPDSVLDAQFARVVEQVGGRANFIKALAAQKLSEDEFRKRLVRGCRVGMLVNQACSSVPEPTEAEIEAYCNAHVGDFGQQAPDLAAAHDSVRDLLRHDARGRAVEALVAELREKATIEYR